MDFSHFLQPQGQGKELTRKLEFQDRLDILARKRFSCVAEQGYTILYGNSHI